MATPIPASLTSKIKGMDMESSLLATANKNTMATGKMTKWVDADATLKNSSGVTVETLKTTKRMDMERDVILTVLINKECGRTMCAKITKFTDSDSDHDFERQ